MPPKSRHFCAWLTHHSGSLTRVDMYQNMSHFLVNAALSFRMWDLHSPSQTLWEVISYMCLHGRLFISIASSLACKVAPSGYSSVDGGNIVVLFASHDLHQLSKKPCTNWATNPAPIEHVEILLALCLPQFRFWIACSISSDKQMLHVGLHQRVGICWLRRATCRACRAVWGAWPTLLQLSMHLPFKLNSRSWLSLQATRRLSAGCSCVCVMIDLTPCAEPVLCRQDFALRPPWQSSFFTPVVVSVRVSGVTEMCIDLTRH